jgi:hypothetical protein
MRADMNLSETPPSPILGRNARLALAEERVDEGGGEMCASIFTPGSTAPLGYKC